MADLTITAADVAPVEILSQFTRPAAEQVYAGNWVYEGTGASVGLASDSAYGDRFGLALRSVITNEAVTVIEAGIVDVGDALAALDIGAKVYQSSAVAGKLATTGSVVIGSVTGGLASTTPDKLLRIERGV
jgi:predicted RecA/RadA family phage recombinase